MAKSQEETSGVNTHEDFQLYVEINLPAVLEAITHSCFQYQLAPNQLITLMLHLSCPNGRFMYALLTRGVKEHDHEKAKQIVEDFLVSDEKRGEMLIAALPMKDVQALLRYLKDDATADLFKQHDNPRDTWVMGCLEDHVWVDGFTIPTSPEELDDAMANSRKYCAKASSKECG